MVELLNKDEKVFSLIITIMIYMSRDTIFVHSLKPDSLQLVAVLHRHGLRTPIQHYENDPYKDQEKYWPIGLGQLTNKGKKQLYNLGGQLRNKYKTFIPKYYANSVRVNSSDFDRTLMSVGALLAAMFPPIREQIWNFKLLWQPIPIYSVPATQDMVISPLAPCPSFWTEHKKVLSEITSNETPEDKELYKYLTKYTGESINTICDLQYIYDTLLTEERNGFILPKWTIPVFPDRMKDKSNLCALSYTANDILKRFYGGPMVKEISHQFKEKSEGHIKDKKLFLYSGHDLSIINVLRALDINDFIHPDFGASIIFELHQLQKKYYVKMLYSHSVEVEHYELDIPKCAIPCPLDELLSITEYVRSVDWSTQCFE